jgi:hypothetical protein
MAKVLKKALFGAELMFPGNFVAAVELKGRDATVTISAVEKADLPREGSSKKDVCPVLSFAETPKKMVLNKTNASTIVGLYGSQAKEWVGKRITLYPTTTKFGGEIVDCIRVRPDAPPEKSTKPTGKPNVTETDVDDALKGAQENAS